MSICNMCRTRKKIKEKVKSALRFFPVKIAFNNNLPRKLIPFLIVLMFSNNLLNAFVKLIELESI